MRNNWCDSLWTTVLLWLLSHRESRIIARRRLLNCTILLWLLMAIILRLIICILGIDSLIVCILLVHTEFVDHNNNRKCDHTLPHSSVKDNNNLHQWYGMVWYVILKSIINETIQCVNIKKSGLGQKSFLSLSMVS